MAINIERLKPIFDGELVLPGDPDYEAALQRWSTGAVCPAGLVAYPKTPEDVSRVVKFAAEHKHDLAIRGGGHSASGASSSDGGVVIDLSRHFAGCEVAERDGQPVANVGGGSVWKTVDEAAIQHGLATVGGTVNHTGCGGLILGGGYGWLTAQHGLAIDNLVEVTLITASGEILTVNATENGDLFWGIRGAGSNFGVVTNFVLRLHPQPRKVFGGPVIFPPPMLGAVVSVLEEWLSAATPLANAMLAFAPGPDGSPAIVVILVYHGTEEDGKKAFKPIFDLGPVAIMTRMIPYEEVNAMTNDVAPPGYNWYISGLTRTHLTAETAVTIHDHLLKLRASHPLLGQFVMVWEYYPMLPKIMSVKADATAFRLRTPDLGCLLSLRWDSSVKDEEVKAKAKELVTEHRIFSEKLLQAQAGHLPRPEADKNVGYGNYEMLDNRAAALFGGNYPRLQKLKAKYDPQLLFSKWYPIQPRSDE